MVVVGVVQSVRKVAPREDSHAKPRDSRGGAGAEESRAKVAPRCSEPLDSSAGRARAQGFAKLRALVTLCRRPQLFIYIMPNDEKCT